jgi:hypothetical protein
MMLFGDVLFWSCLFGVLNASCTWLSICFPGFGKNSAIIFLSKFSMPLVCILVLSPTSQIYRFGLLVVSQKSWLLCS